MGRLDRFQFQQKPGEDWNSFRTRSRSKAGGRFDPGLGGLTEDFNDIFKPKLGAMMKPKSDPSKFFASGASPARAHDDLGGLTTSDAVTNPMFRASSASPAMAHNDMAELQQAADTPDSPGLFADINDGSAQTSAPTSYGWVAPTARDSFDILKRYQTRGSTATASGTLAMNRGLPY